MNKVPRVRRGPYLSTLFGGSPLQRRPDGLAVAARDAQDHHISASWSGDPQNPEMISNRKVWVSDPKRFARGNGGGGPRFRVGVTLVHQDSQVPGQLLRELRGRHLRS